MYINWDYTMFSIYSYQWSFCIHINEIFVYIHINEIFVCSVANIFFVLKRLLFAVRSCKYIFVFNVFLYSMLYFEPLTNVTINISQQCKYLTHTHWCSHWMDGQQYVWTSFKKCSVNIHILSFNFNTSFSSRLQHGTVGTLAMNYIYEKVTNVDNKKV